MATLAFQLAAAQTFTKCNPMQKTCPADLGLGGAETADFTAGSSTAFFPTAGPITYGPNGAEFTITKKGDAPTLQSKPYLMFGHVDVLMKASPGTGIVSTIVLESDDLDEVDWECLGGDDTQIQTNYFGKGNTTSYTRGGFSAVTTPQTLYHVYGLDWTQERIQWSIDGVVTRTLNYGDALGGRNYPQTPMNIRIGTWAAGDSGNAPGTIQWAGGVTDYSDGPFTAYVKSVKMTDYSTGACYVYGDHSGSYTSIESLPASNPLCASAISAAASEGGSGASNSTTSSTAPAVSASSAPSNSTTSALSSTTSRPFTTSTISTPAAPTNGILVNGSNTNTPTSPSAPATTTASGKSDASSLARVSTLVFGLALAVAFVL